MQLPFHIIEMLKRKSHSDLRLPSDCELLSLDMESKTGVHIGATTLKRLLGFAQDERTPHTYLGYRHWEELSKVESQGNSDFDAVEGEIRSADLKVGAQVEFTYLPDRLVRLSYLGNCRFRVIMSENSKLQADDEVEVLSFVLHHPLLVIGVWRNDESLGQFTAGRVSGLSSIIVQS